MYYSGMIDPLHPSVEEYYGHPIQGAHCQVLYCGREACLPSNQVEVIRSEVLFHLVVAGKGTVSYGRGNKKLLGPGEGFFRFPGQPCKYWPDSAQPWAYSWIGFSATDQEPLLAGIGIDPQHPIITLPDPAPAFDCLDGMLTLLKDCPANAHLRACSLLYKLLAELSAGSSGVPCVSLSQSPVAAAKDFIQNRFHRGITAKEVAEYIGFESSYLLKLFRRETGMSIRDYIIQTRLAQARILLKEPGIPIGDVSRAVGFRSYASFEKTFRRWLGRTPTDYRSGMFF
jgi:AraC-type DNA-binding domain-containing proteins